ncbi:MAG: DUF4416 family protein [Rectinemataceae bacterium]
MGTPKAFGCEMAVVGVLSSDPELDGPAIAGLEALFGPVVFRTEPEDFTWTDYYVPEMGTGIRRFYLAFGTLVDPSRLAEFKLATNGIEENLATGGPRRVNLDPGLLAPGRFVLATTKDRAHRIALASGIFCELTLIYEKGAFHSLPWTYPDWASAPCREMLALWRKDLMARLKSAEKPYC